MTSTKQGRVIPTAGSVPNVKRDALEAFQVLKSGGVVIVPSDVGYGIVSSSAEGIERAFAAKKRKPGHTLGIIGSYKQHTELHVLGNSPEESAKLFEITRVVTLEMGALVAFTAKYRRDHPRLQQLSSSTLQMTTKGDTMGIAIPDGPFLTELSRLNDEDGQLMVGSSANLTGQGQKFRIEDIEPEVLQAADLIVNYGLQKWHLYGRAATIFDLTQMKVTRIGAGYEVFRERMSRWFQMDLPEDPEWKTYENERIGVSIEDNCQD